MPRLTANKLCFSFWLQWPLVCRRRSSKSFFHNVSNNGMLFSPLFPILWGIWGFIQNHAAPKIIIISGIIDSIILDALSLAAMSVKSPIFQPRSSYGSFLLTVTQNGNDFSFHYELSVFHLGRMMIDFHSSSILPYWGLLTLRDTMQNARHS